MKRYVFVLGLMVGSVQLSGSQAYNNALKTWESISGTPDAITIKRDEYRDLIAQNMQLKKDNQSAQAEVQALKKKVEQLEKQLQKK